MKGSKTLDYFRFYRETLSWSRDQVTALQISKMKRLMQHAYDNIPFYKNRFSELGATPHDFKTLADLAKFPVLTREDIMSGQNELLDKTNKYARQIPGSSSGTTGVPIRYVHDPEGDSAGVAAVYALYSLSGWRLNNKNLHIWGNPESIKKWKKISSKLKRKLLNQKNYPAFLLNNPENFSGLLTLIHKYKPVYIDGYTSSIGSFASWLEKNNIFLKNIKTVFTTAENLTSKNKELISKHIGPVSDLYGSGEVNGIAIQPASHNRYYVLEPHVIAETIEQNGINELIVTDLDNRVMPFIRYKTEDTIDFLSPPSTNEILPFSSFGSINGRLLEYIRLSSGKIIHPVNVLGGTFLRKFPQITKHKVVWNGSTLRFVLECNSEIDVDALNREIYSNIKEYEVTFTIEITDKLLPGKTGKFRYIEIENNSVL